MLSKTFGKINLLKNSSNLLKKLNTKCKKNFQLFTIFI